MDDAKIGDGARNVAPDDTPQDASDAGRNASGAECDAGDAERDARHVERDARKRDGRKPKARKPTRRGTRRLPRSRLSPAAREEMFRRLSAQRPAPEAELEWRDPFTLLVAVTLSAQATDRGVNRATRTLFAAAPDPAAMAALGVEGIGGHVRTIGLWRNKARNVHALSERLVAEHGGRVPEDREALEALPGVGRKTANVVLNIAFGHSSVAVDTHIFRLSNRIGLAPGRDPLEVERVLERAVPPAYLRDSHHWMILHGRYVCTARSPRCGRCVIADLCRFRDKTSDVPAPIVVSPPNGPPATDGPLPADGPLSTEGATPDEPDEGR